MGYQSVLLYDRGARAGAVVLTNATQPAHLRDVAAELVPDFVAQSHELDPPSEIAPLLGAWWSEGVEHRFRWTGRLETDDAQFAAEGPDRFRTVGGREEGELLLVLRDASGEPVELRWAGYPFRREPGYSY